jgi:branched-chain amino acid transport system substrate-binding protein
MKRADKAGALTGEGILKKGFETMKDYAILDGGLGTAPVTFTRNRPSNNQYRSGL